MVATLRGLLDRRLTLSIPTAAAIVAMQVLLTVSSYLLLQQNRSLRDLAAMNLALAAPVVGRNVPALTGKDLTGATRAVEYGEDPRPTLIYGFSQECGPCITNWAAMRAIQEMSPGKLRIVYINTSDNLTPDYLREHGIPQDAVLSALDPNSVLHYGIKATPQSELVNGEGIVVWTKLGKFEAADLEDLVTAIQQAQQ